MRLSAADGVAGKDGREVGDPRRSLLMRRLGPRTHTLPFFNYRLTDRPVDTGSRPSPGPSPRAFGKISSLSPPPPALAGALRGAPGRLSAPLFLLMRFSRLSGRRRGVARLRADSSLSPFQGRPWRVVGDTQASFSQVNGKHF